MAVTFELISSGNKPLVSADEEAQPSVWGGIESQLFAWLGDVCNPTIDPLSILTGSGYGADSVYTGVDLRRTASTQTGGKGMKATLTVTGGGISAVEITSKGNGYKAGDSLVISDLTQMAGTGSGFRVDVDSGDASLGLIKSLDDATDKTSYPVGWLFGVNRSSSYTYGTRLMKTHNSQTTYAHTFYDWTNGSDNNGYYDAMSNQQQNSISTWYEGLGNNYEVYCIYCSDPGNRFFFTSDSGSSSNSWGFYEDVQQEGGIYPPESVVSRWVFNYGKDTINWHAQTPAYYSTPYTGWETDQVYTRPKDPGVFFGNQAISGRAWTLGTTPPRIKFHATTDMGWGHIYQQGSDTYRRLVDALYILMN